MPGLLGFPPLKTGEGMSAESLVDAEWNRGHTSGHDEHERLEFSADIWLPNIEFQVKHYFLYLCFRSCSLRGLSPPTIFSCTSSTLTLWWILPISVYICSHFSHVNSTQNNNFLRLVLLYQFLSYFFPHTQSQNSWKVDSISFINSHLKYTAIWLLLSLHHPNSSLSLGSGTINCSLIPDRSPLWLPGNQCSG